MECIGAGNGPVAFKEGFLKKILKGGEPKDMGQVGSRYAQELADATR